MAQLLPRQRVLRILDQQPVDRFPAQLNYRRALRPHLAALLGVPADRLDDALFHHFILVSAERSFPADSLIYEDEWGVYWYQREGHQLDHTPPLAHIETLPAYDWPDLEHPNRYLHARARIAANAGRRFVLARLGLGLFERCWSLRGFENTLRDLMLNQAFIRDLLEHIVGVQLGAAQRLIELGIDGLYLRDNFAAAFGMVLSPDAWRLLFKPRLAQLITPFKAAGKHVFFQCEGDFSAILPDLLELGVDAIGPCDPIAGGLDQLLDRIEGRIAYFGGLDIDRITRADSDESVRRLVRETSALFGRSGTGWIPAFSRPLDLEFPLERLALVLDTLDDSTRIPSGVISSR
ncbi:MAG TPA: uroporphyrinogen decarboxylase family protein [Candidatus Sumerlaeota bacterium]|nr:uroporphyrinogen decarboxylase family protein [Candidatus Sumerlaeota bacterium]HOR29583.1 uroporphyrinogen decarboxylase family protein [Candidatus Sumerlaeota bacterium]HPK00816.1 uroporphyrinogen decarboxylase family protein [Candidatus Sumerlaeota bacterium]